MHIVMYVTFESFKARKDMMEEKVEMACVSGYSDFWILVSSLYFVIYGQKHNNPKELERNTSPDSNVILTLGSGVIVDIFRCFYACCEHGN